MIRAIDTAPQALVVALAKVGNRAAFTELVRRKQSWLRSLMWRLCNDPSLADDLAQQAFLQAWRDIGRLREPNKFSGWLKRLAINVWLKHQRKQDPLRASESGATDARTIHESPGLNRDLHQALATLSVEVRTCIVLSLNEGISHSEIASLTGQPLGTVKSHIRRGTQQLQEILADYGPNIGTDNEQ